MTWQRRSPGRLPSRQWRAIRARLMAQEPWCRTCSAAGQLTRDSRATVLDHIVSLAAGGSNDDANLQPLCAACHDLKTLQEAARARGAAEPSSIRARPTIGADGWPA